MSQKINFSDYPASGVYYIEIDNSIVSSSNVQTALRMAVGFNMRGPFNRPCIYLTQTSVIIFLALLTERWSAEVAGLIETFVLCCRNLQYM